MSSVSVQWLAVNGSNAPFNYRICIRTSVDICVSVSSTSYVFTNLPNSNSAYNVTVTVLDIQNSLESALSSIIAYTTPSAGLLSLVGSTTSTLGLSWSSSAGSNALSVAYELCCSSSCVNITSLSFTFSNLAAGTSYVCSVRSFSIVGSAITAPMIFSTIPAAPLGLIQQGATTSSISIQWQTVVGGNSPFLYRVCINATATVNVCVDVSSTSHTFTGLSVSNSAYTVTITTVDSARNLLSATRTLAAYTSPSAVSAMFTSVRTATSFSTFWTVPPNNALPISYEVCCSSMCFNTSTNSYSFNALTSAAIYTCTVRSITVVGSSISTPFSIRTLPVSPTGVRQQFA